VFLNNLTNPGTAPRELQATIANTNLSLDATINRFFMHWVEQPAQQKLDRILLNSEVIWNTSDPDSPSDIPREGPNWAGGDRTIPLNSSEPLNVQFSDPLAPGMYEVHIVFDTGCRVTNTLTIP
jgi:hypothetical protein